MTLAREEFGAIESEGLYPDQDLVFRGSGIGRLSIFRTSGPPAVRITAAFIVAMASLHLLTFATRRVGGRKTITSDFPIASDLLKDEEFLVGLWAALARCIDLDHPSRIRARKCPIVADLFDFSDANLTLNVIVRNTPSYALRTASAPMLEGKFCGMKTPSGAYSVHDGRRCQIDSMRLRTS